MQVYDQLENLVGVSQLPINSTLIFTHSAIDRPLYIRSGANSIKWSYRLNTQSTPTVGGEVVQILSCFVGPITIEGLAAGYSVMEDGGNKYTPAGFGPGAFTPTDEMSMIVLWFTEYMHKAGGGRKRRIEEAVKMTYQARGWEFYIQPTDIQGFDIKNTNVAQPWSVTAEVVDDPGLDYFVSETMSQYTDSLTSRASLQVAISPGFEFASNPFVNPWLNTSISASALAARMGDNFQALVAAWAYGDFSVFNSGFSTLADPKRQTGVDNPYDYYTQLVGGTYIGDATKITADYNAAFSGAGTGGSEVLPGDTSVDQWIISFLKAMGVNDSQQNRCFMKSWAAKEGGHTNNANKFNWLNHVYENQPGASPRVVVGNDGITRTFASYDTEQHGVEGLVRFLSKSKYIDINNALRSGNPLGQWPDEGLQTWVGGSNRTSTTKAYSNWIKQRTQSCVASAAEQPSVTAGNVYIPAESWVGTHTTDSLGWGYNTAIDLIVSNDSIGRPIGSPVSGTIVYYKPGGAQGGSSMLLRGDNGYEYWLGHITRGKSSGRVKRGDIICYIAGPQDDPSGWPSGMYPHLHIDRRRL